MKIQELRIGNYVKGTFTNFCEDEAPQNECVCEIVILDETAQSGFTKWANSIEEKGKFVEEWDRLDGIVLNEKWLLKFGFGKMIGFFITTSPNIILELSENNDNSTIQWYCYVRNMNGHQNDDFALLRKDLQYVHQLQNLYFALTGEELVLSEA